MTDIATLSVKVTTKGIKDAHRELDKLGKEAKLAETKTKKLANAAKKVGSAFTGLSGAISAVGLGLAARKLIDYTDRMANLQGQLKLVTDSQGELNEVYNRSLGLANSTGASLEATINLYTRMARSTEELGLSTDNLFTITKAINQSFVVSGASAQEAASATLQLSQGLAAGALRGEELNSVMENSPRLARALADGLGVGIGQLRVMGAEGGLTAEKVTGAISKMAEEIDAEFQEMPMTFSRIGNEIQNNLLDIFGNIDTSPAIESFENLAATLDDPQMKTNLQTLGTMFAHVGAEILNLSLAAAEFVLEWSPMGLIGKGIAAVIDGLRGKFGLFKQDVDYMAEALEATGTATVGFTGSLLLGKKRVDLARKSIAASNKELDEFIDKQIKTEAAQYKVNNTTKEQEKVMKAATAQHKRNTAALERGFKAMDDIVAKGRQYIEGLRHEVSLIGKTEKEQYLLNKAYEQGTRLTAEQVAEAARLNEALWENEQATKAATESMDPWLAALEQTAKRIDESFVDMWRNAGSGFDDFKDSVVNSFKDMLAEMAHLAVTRPIVVGITSALGLGGSSGALASGGGIGIGDIIVGGKTAYDLMTGGNFLSTAGGYISGAGSSLYGALASSGAYGGQLANGLYNTGNSIATSGIVGQGTQTLGAGTAIGVAANVGAGFAGNWAGGQIFDQSKYSNVGGTVGGAIGTVVGLGNPLFTAIGAFIGNGIGSLFGRVKADLTRQMVDFEDMTNTRSDNRGHDMDEAATSLGDMILEFGSIVGATGKYKFSVHGEEGIRYESPEGRQTFGQDSKAFFQVIFDDMVESSDTLSDRLKVLLIAFDGNIERTGRYTASLVTLEELIEADPLGLATKQFEDAVKEANTTLYDTYQKQGRGLARLIENYDGSLGRTEWLTAAYARQQQAAYELALAITAITASIAELVETSAASYRDVGKTEEEKFGETFINFLELRQQLEAMEDPEEIASTVATLDTMLRSLFEGLDPEQQLIKAEGFATAIEDIGATADRQLKLTFDNAQAAQEALAESIGIMLDTAAANLQTAATDFQGSVNYFAEVTDQLAASLNFRPRESEVNV